MSKRREDLESLLLESTTAAPLKDTTPKKKIGAPPKKTSDTALKKVVTEPTKTSATKPVGEAPTPPKAAIGTPRSMFLSPTGKLHLGPLENILGAPVTQTTPYTELRPLPDPNQRMTPQDIARLAYQAGFRGESLVTAVAVSLGESIQGVWNATGDVNRVGERTAKGHRWGPSLGLWQIRSIQELAGSGDSRDPVSLLNPAFNAKAAYEISGGGKNFKPWTVYTKGTYKKYLDEAREAVDGLGGNLRVGLVFVSEEQAGSLVPNGPNSLMDTTMPQQAGINPGLGYAQPIPTANTGEFFDIPTEQTVTPSQDTPVEAVFPNPGMGEGGQRQLADTPPPTSGDGDAVRSMVRSLFISFHGREPTPQEIEYWSTVVAGSDDLMAEFEMARNRGITA